MVGELGHTSPAIAPRLRAQPVWGDTPEHSGSALP